MNVTFRQLEIFRALVATGSISAAARDTKVTQPTASVHLRDLTEAVGMPLYEVIGRKVFLTEAGRELAKAARLIARGGYIPYVDHAVPPGVSWENFTYYRERLNEIIETVKITG